MLGSERIALINAILARVSIIGIGLAFLYIIRDIVFAVLTAVVIASSFEPLIRRLVRVHIPRTAAVLLLYFGILLLLIASVFFILPVVAEEITDIAHVLPDYLDGLAVSAPFINEFKDIMLGYVQSTSVGDYIRNTVLLISMFGSDTYALGTAVFGGISSFIIIIVLSFYLNTQEDGVADFLRIITPLKYEKYVISLWRRSQRNIGRWMQGQVFLALLVGIFAYIGLSALGVRHAFTLAVIAGLFEIIPVFGPILGSIPAIMVGFLDGGVSLALLVAAVYVVIQQLESHVMYPLVVRKIIGVPPLVVIISLIIGFQLGGLLGVILSIPLATVFIEYIGDRERNRRTTIELGER